MSPLAVVNSQRVEELSGTIKHNTSPCSSTEENDPPFLSSQCIDNLCLHIFQSTTVQSRSQSPRAFWSAPRHGALK